MDVYRIGYRLYAKDPLDGEGSFLYGGRWSSVGTRMVYTSTTLSLSMAEFLTHVTFDDFDRDALPELMYVRATLPDAAILELDEIGARLPADWNAVPAPAVDAVLGDAWIRTGRSLGLYVPSVLIPVETPERNVLINPLHPEFPHAVWTVNEFSYDQRLLATRGPVRYAPEGAVRG